MKLFVWDLHGVLETGNDKAVLEISNQVLQQHGYKIRFRQADIDRLYGLKWWEYFKDLLPEETRERHLELQEACIQISVNHPEIITRHMKSTPYAHDVLHQIEEKHKQILISNTAPEALPQFLQALNMTPYFQGKFFATNSHRQKGGRTKHDLLKEQLHQQSFQKVVLIGDSEGDMALAETMNGIPTVTYLYAHPHKQHKPGKAQHYIQDLREILKEV